MNKRLEHLIEKARKIQMTESEEREQRRSFVYGNTKIENEFITRELVNEVDKELEDAQKK